MDTLPIINDKLSWDGSHIGTYYKIITNKWTVGGVLYYKICFSDKDEIGPGMILCSASCTKDPFPCIVEDIKTVFGLTRRGVHRISIDNKEYILYYSQITIAGLVVWETPLSKLNTKHELRTDYEFRKNVQKIIAFCDILALTNTKESSIKIRSGVNDTHVPICFNETTTSLLKDGSDNYSILTKTLFAKWFGEEVSLCDVLKELIEAKFGPISIQRTSRLCAISSDIRNQIDAIIKNYDTKYIWYSYFIVDRLSRHLLLI